MFFLDGSVGVVQFYLEKERMSFKYSVLKKAVKIINMRKMFDDSPENLVARAKKQNSNTPIPELADKDFDISRIDVMGFPVIKMIHKSKSEKANLFIIGGGRNLSALLLKFPNAFGTGVDYSELSVKKARDYNRVLIEDNRCDVVQGDVSALKLKRNNYDLATAFETIYFWPGLEKCFAQVASTLKRGSTFMIVNESDGNDRPSKKYEKIIEGMKVYTADQIAVALQRAGFGNIRVEHHRSKPWIAVYAVKV